jgi:hypothetical protein
MTDLLKKLGFEVQKPKEKVRPLFKIVLMLNAPVKVKSKDTKTVNFYSDKDTEEERKEWHGKEMSMPDYEVTKFLSGFEGFMEAMERAMSFLKEHGARLNTICVYANTHIKQEQRNGTLIAELRKS